MKELEVKDERSIEEEALLVEVKDFFDKELKNQLNLIKVNAPLYVSSNSGLNDNLNGIEKPVSFNLYGKKYEIVHSLAKWKRWYLGELGVRSGFGLVTDMRAIRVDEQISEIHSNYVDQWDWEKVIDKEERTISTLVDQGKKVYSVLKKTERFFLKTNDQGLESILPDEITVIHAESLLQEYPELSPKEREDHAAKKYRAILLIGIGGKLSDGSVHDLRAPDYDDWSTLDSSGRPGLNADLIVWDAVREKSLELSSMGVRVDKEVLYKQLKEMNCEDRLELAFHKALIDGALPYTIGGGIGQSRVAMFILRLKDIKEVQPVFE